MRTGDLTVYEPDARRKVGSLGLWKMMLRNIITFRELIIQLFKRDFLSSYKKSFAGITWLFISPVFGIVSWVFMNSTGLLNTGDVGIPYPAYVLLGSSIWGLFMGFFTSAQDTLSTGAALVFQVRFPHEILLLKQVAQHLAAFVIGFAFNIIVLLVFGVVPSWKIVLFPVFALPLFFFGAGIGLVVSVIGVVATEIRTIINVAFGFLIYVTPVIYSPTFKNPILQSVIKWNPLSYLISGARDMIVYGRLEHGHEFLLTSALSLLVFLVSWRIFFVTEERVIEKMI